jgi:hypothetical protein
MSNQVTVKDVFKIIIEEREINHEQYSEITLKLFVDPFVFVQLLAWNNNAAYLNEKDILVCKDWNKIPKSILKEIRMTLFTCYRSLMNGKILPDDNGVYTIKGSGAVTTIQEGGFVSVVDPEDVNKFGKNYRRREYP